MSDLTVTLPNDPVPSADQGQEIALEMVNYKVGGQQYQIPKVVFEQMRKNQFEEARRNITKQLQSEGALVTEDVKQKLQAYDSLVSMKQEADNQSFEWMFNKLDPKVKGLFETAVQSKVNPLVQLSEQQKKQLDEIGSKYNALLSQNKQFFASSKIQEILKKHNVRPSLIGLLTTDYLNKIQVDDSVSKIDVREEYRKIVLNPSNANQIMEYGLENLIQDTLQPDFIEPTPSGAGGSYTQATPQTPIVGAPPHLASSSNKPGLQGMLANKRSN